jgi:polyphosphate glucokinase
MCYSDSSDAPEVRHMPDSNPVTFAIDIGGTGLKVEFLDAAGEVLGERHRMPTPQPSSPVAILSGLKTLAANPPAFDRISAGFPGVVRDGKIITAPHLGTDAWRGFDLAAELTKAFGQPARVLNDAEVQGFGLIAGRGLEFVLTLGTGAGTALFHNGVVAPHLELSQHPVRHDMTYDEYIGNAALEKEGVNHWNERVQRVLTILRTLTNFDKLYLGGGNAKKVETLPPDVVRGSNEAGLAGGVKLWGPGWPA